jgi:GT2 family glycosyltransferase
MNKPKVSVIINCFSQMECSSAKKFPYFSFCKPLGLESVKRQNYKNKEIILADKNSPHGAGAIRNEAVKRAKGDILFFLDADAVMVGKDYISKIIRIFEEVDTDVVVASSIPNKKLSKSLFQYLLALEYEEREKNMGEGYIDAGATTYFAIKRDILKKIGGIPLKSSSIDTKNLFFDSGFLDWDLCGELRLKRYKIWHTNKAKVYHLMQTDFFSYFKKQFIQAWYRIAYFKKYKKIREGYSKFNFFYPNVFKFYEITKNWKVFLFLPISIIRNLVWFLGFLKGFWNFYIKNDYLLKKSV